MNGKLGFGVNLTPEFFLVEYANALLSKILY